VFKKKELKISINGIQNIINPIQNDNNIKTMAKELKKEIEKSYCKGKCFIPNPNFMDKFNEFQNTKKIDKKENNE